MKKRLLIAVNEFTLRKLMDFVLNKDFEVRCAENGQEALALLESDQSFDLLIADAALERLNGYELVNKVKTHPYMKSIPTLIITSKPGKEEQTFYKEVGGDDLLIRPFNPIEMMLKIQKLLVKKENVSVEKLQP